MSRDRSSLFAEVVLVALCAPALGPAQNLVSDLPLDAGLGDSATRRTAIFTRGSAAYSYAGELVGADTPRYEPIALATGFEWQITLREHELVPIAVAAGELFATNNLHQILASQDGETFEFRSAAPVPLTGRTTAWTTPAGALMVAGLPPGATGGGHVYRSADGGRTFELVLVFPAGFARHWNFAALGTTVFVSEYDNIDLPYQGDNGRRIYRSEDDGRTFNLVFEPPPQAGWHDHQILGDPWRDCLYQSVGDLEPGIWRSTDHGDTWHKIHDYYMPISGVVREEGAYWGHDGLGASAVERFEPATGRWTLPHRAWNGYLSNTSRQGNCSALFEHSRILHVPYVIQINETWLSRTGDDWAFGRAFPTTDRGTYRLVGLFRGWIYGMYHQGNGEHTAYMKIRPGRVATVNGLRIDPPVVNLLTSDQLCSAENGLDGWYHSSAATLAWDTERSYHGSASVAFSNPNLGSDAVIMTPPLPYSLPVGTVVHGQLRITGDESALCVGLVDAVHNVGGKIVRTSACDDWTVVRPELTITDPINSIAFIIYGDADRVGVARVWLDAFQLSATLPGETWQPGGTPRTAETVRHTVDLSGDWTDFVWFRPDFDSEQGPPGWRTLKAWVQTVNDYAAVVFDSADQRFKLVQVVAGAPPTVMAATNPVVFWRGYTARLAVRSSANECSVRVRFGSSADSDLSAAGPPLDIQPLELWIGSRPGADDQAPGVYALSRTFGAALSEDELLMQLEYLPRTSTSGLSDCNCDDRLDFDDVPYFVAALQGEEAWRALYLSQHAGAAPPCSYWNANCDGSTSVDFDDLAAFINWLSQ